jgi:uncharacterized short protein YbdD (DUF466 family)
VREGRQKYEQYLQHLKSKHTFDDEDKKRELERER